MMLVLARRARGVLRALARPLPVAVALLAATSPAGATIAARPEAAPPVVGYVRDVAGNPLPNAQVVVVEVSRATTTSMDGRFVLAGLPAGLYHVNTFLLGYAPVHTVVTLPVEGDTVRLAITMERTMVRLQTVQVTATPTGTDPMNITQATVEMSGKELGRNLGASVAQTLSAEPGMSTRYNGPSASTPVIRGLTGERILVLQDGERAADLSSASADHGLTVDPLNAQRIEVVRGPASLLYGNNALGGVVNVISNDIPTVVPTHLEGYIGGQAESVNPGAATSLSLTTPVGGSAVATARGGWRRMEDVRTGGGGRLDNTDARNWNGVAGIGLVGSRATGGAAYRVMDFAYGVPSRPGADESGVRIRGRRHQVSARTQATLGTSLLSNARLDGTAQWYTHDEIEPSGAVGTTFDLRTQTVNATGRTQFGKMAGAFGVQGLFKQYSPTGEEALTPAARSTSGGVFLYQEYPFGENPVESRTPRLQMGARYDAYRIAGEDSDDPKFGAGRTRDFRNLSGSLGVSIPLGAGVSLSGSAARAFRAPTVEELFSNGFHHAAGTFDLGTPTLRAETNRGFDAVLRAQSGRTYAQLAAYHNRIDDYIAPRVLGDTVIDGEDPSTTLTVPVVQYRQSAATLRGLEGQVEVALGGRWVVGAMGDVVRGRFEEDGAPLPFMPGPRVGGSLRWDDGRFSAGTEVRHGLAQDRVTQPECGEAPTADEACVDVATPAYTVANVSAGFNIIQGPFVHSLTLRVDNAFDERFYDAASRIKAFAANPGRNFSIVYRVLF